MNLAKSKLFQYAVIWHPTEKQSKEEDKKSILIVEPTTILASDDKAVGMMAVMSIPENKRKEVDQIEIVIRPF